METEANPIGYAIEEMKSLNDKHFKKMFDLIGVHFIIFWSLLKSTWIQVVISSLCYEAVSCAKNVLTSYRGHMLGVAKDSFNFHLSSMRQCIVRAFAV